VLLIVVDTLRADATSAYDPTLDTSPELQRWAQHGVLFERTRSQSSWTKISVASLMTSLWPSSHGIHEPSDGLSDDALTLAEVLQHNGYATYGVQTNGWLHQSFGFSQGFDRYVFPRGGSQRNFPRASIWPHADRVYEEMARTLKAHDRSAPFFLYLHFMDVHEYAAPPEYKRYGTDSRGAYLAAVGWVDATLRRIREQLEAAELLDSTLIIFASDHGETFGEHGVYGHARNVLSPVLSVPLIVRLPVSTGPIRVASQVRILDVAPTILAALNVPPPASFEGRSLLPLMAPATSSAATDRISFAGLGKTLFRDASVQRSISSGHWTYARNLDEDAEPAEFLFDRCVDRGENVNLIAMATERTPAEQMRTMLDDHLARVVDDVRQEDVTIDPGIEERLRALGYLGDQPID
jgi:arylsulfatase A-like enzyme